MVTPPRAVANPEEMLKDPAGPAALAKLDKLPPDTTDPAKRSEFYQRGVTARELGSIPPAIRDLEQALAYARNTRAPEYKILAQLGWAEYIGGDVARSKRLHRQGSSRSFRRRQRLLVSRCPLLSGHQGAPSRHHQRELSRALARRLRGR